MTKIRIVPISLVIAFSFALIAIVPASAQHGADDGVSGGSSSSGSGSGSGSGATTTTTTTTAQQRLDDSRQRLEEKRKANEAAHPELESESSKSIEQLRQQRGQKSTEERKKQCVAHQKGLNQKFSKIGTNVQRIQTKIDTIYSRAQKYATDNNLNPDGYQTLVANADAAKAASAKSIADLKQVTPTNVDCSNPNVAQDVATFKAAAQNTRTNLKAYKTAVKAVLNALQLPQGRANSGNVNPSSNSQGSN